jgi:hypothetical protein
MGHVIDDPMQREKAYAKIHGLLQNRARHQISLRRSAFLSQIDQQVRRAKWSYP